MIYRPETLIRRRRLPGIARTVAGFALLLLVVSIAGSWLNAWRGLEVYILLAVVSGIAVLAIVLAAWSLVVIWIWGGYNAHHAGTAIWRSMLALLPIACMAALWGVLPPAIDIASDPEAPIRRPSSTINYRDETLPDPAAQAERYGAIRVLEVAEPADRVFGAVVDLIERRKWRIVRIDEPSPGRPVHRIEAVARMPFLGLAADIAIEVEQRAAFSTVAMRSIARFGDHDLGSNALRIFRLQSTLLGRFTPYEEVIEEAEEAPGLPGV